MKLSPIQIKYRNQFLEKLSNGIYRVEPNRCICGHNDDMHIANIDRYKIPLTTVLCQSCGLMRSDPYYNSDTLSGFYKDEYRGIYNGNIYPSDNFFKEQVVFGGDIYKFITKEYFKSDINNKKIFEIGCGAGGILKYLSDKGNRVYGCDFGEDYIKFGVNKGLKNIVTGDIDALFKFGKADVIILNHVLEHFPDPVKQLNKIKNLLREDGILYVAVPGVYQIHDNYTELALFLQNAHVFHYTLKTLTAVLNRAGYYYVGGNENIQAIFKIGNVSNNLANENAEDLYKYLQKIALLKYYYKSQKINLMTTIVETLRVNNWLYDMSRKIYRKYIKNDK
jgi:2-polyprenyl-3-methyl-5-hydroxy-6-metoxy-1,4-benzoquinol methylase